MMSLAGKPARSREQLVGTSANFDAARERVGLPALVERHHDDRGAISPNESRLAQKFLLARLERDGVHHALALGAFQPGFEHAPFRAVDHEGHARDLRLAPDQVQKPRHGRFGIEHALVEIDVDEVGAVCDLLARDRDRAVEVAAQDELRKLWRTGDVGALAHDDEAELRRHVQRLESGQTQCGRGRGAPDPWSRRHRGAKAPPTLAVAAAAVRGPQRQISRCAPASCRSSRRPG